ncbi:TPA: hypothetical protein I0H29_RS14485, partial [Enterococcus faecalis]|nr:hypothetical protein [Enterococcus faecalis]
MTKKKFLRVSRKEEKKHYKQYKRKKVWVTAVAGCTIFIVNSFSGGLIQNVLLSEDNFFISEAWAEEETNYINNPNFEGTVVQNSNSILPNWTWRFKTNNKTTNKNGTYWNDSSPYVSPNSSTGWEARFQPESDGISIETWLRSNFSNIGTNDVRQTVTGLTTGTRYVLKGNIFGDSYGSVSNTVDTVVKLDSTNVASIKNLTGEISGNTSFEYDFVATKSSYSLVLENYTPSGSLGNGAIYNSRFSNLVLTEYVSYNPEEHKPTIDQPKEGDNAVTGTGVP